MDSQHSKPLSKLHPLVARHATSPNAYATLQPFLQHFHTTQGFIAYGHALGGVITIDDPIASPTDCSSLFSKFLDTFTHATLVNLSEQAARTLAQTQHTRPIYFTPIGTEHCLRLDDTTLAAPLAKPVRGALKKARRARLHIVEHDLATLSSAMHRHIQHINADFLSRSQPGHEIPFIARQFILKPEPDVRFFTIHHADRRSHRIPCGFLTLDPWYKGGRLVGYQLNHTRFYPTRIWGVYLSLVEMLRRQLHQEGIELLSLGACAMHQTEQPHDLPTNTIYRGLLEAAHTHADRVHKMSNFTAMKLLFPGFEIRRFIASTDPAAVIGLLRLLRVSNTLSWQVLRTQFARALDRSR